MKLKCSSVSETTSDSNPATTNYRGSRRHHQHPRDAVYRTTQKQTLHHTNNDSVHPRHPQTKPAHLSAVKKVAIGLNLSTAWLAAPPGDSDRGRGSGDDILLTPKKDEGNRSDRSPLKTPHCLLLVC